MPCSISRAPNTPNVDKKKHTVSLKGVCVEGKMGRSLTKPRKHISVRHGVAHATSGYLMALAVQLTAVATASQASAGITAWTTQSTRFMTIRQSSKGCRSCGWSWACEKSGNLLMLHPSFKLEQLELCDERRSRASRTRPTSHEITKIDLNWLGDSQGR